MLFASACGGSAAHDSPATDVTPKTSTPATTLGPSSSTTQFSPGQHLRFERLSLEQGLSQSTVFSMLQDSQGFIWFGTEDGLLGRKPSAVLQEQVTTTRKLKQLKGMLDQGLITEAEYESKKAEILADI